MQVLLTDVMEGADQTTLQQAKAGLDGDGVHIAHGVLLPAAP